MLDLIEKLSRILFAGIGAFVFALAGLQIKWAQVGLADDQFCFDYAFRYAEAEVLTRVEGVPDLLVERYATRCGVDGTEAYRVLAGDKVLAEVVAYGLAEPADAVIVSADPDDPRPTGAEPGAPVARPWDGFVPLGPVDPSEFSPVNFDIAATGAPVEGAPPQGTVLRARWSVNLRANTANTVSGANPILGVIDEGTCLSVQEPPQTARGQLWAPVTRVTCQEAA